ncbi:hypothetical protein PG991_007851 [Apiospora marii]|uniref:Heterokaryon incompatibility domain-containing protein n=1 Tax=Apiospora marii TaxID=335849 RepID=A0ABR1RUM8_9PEZI
MVLLLEAFQPSQGWSGGLEKLLPSTRHLSATDPRDKVYAFLGLSHKRDELDAMTNIPPDYTIDVDLLYCYTAKLIMHESVTLSMLCHVQREPNSSFLPSWVPDWRDPATIRILGETKPGRRPIYSSPKWSSSNQILDLQMDLRTLKVYGISFDTIEEVRTDIWLADKCRPGQTLLPLGPNLHAFLKDVHDFMTTPLLARSHDMPTGDVQARLAVMQEMVDWATQSTGLRWTSQWLIQRYMDVQTAGLSVDTKDLRPGAPAWHYFMEKPPPDIIRREDMYPVQRPSSNYHPIQPQMQSATPSYNTVQPPASSHQTRSATPSDPMQSPTMIDLSDFTTQTTTPPNRGHFGAHITAEHMALADKIKFGRAMFRTSKLAKVGLCPEWAQPGDVVCYLRGATMPMALRPRGEAFTLAGECYVHEKMSESFQSSEEIRSFILV